MNLNHAIPYVYYWHQCGIEFHITSMCFSHLLWSPNFYHTMKWRMTILLVKPPHDFKGSKKENENWRRIIARPHWTVGVTLKASLSNWNFEFSIYIIQGAYRNSICHLNFFFALINCKIIIKSIIYERPINLFHTWWNPSRLSQ